MKTAIYNIIIIMMRYKLITNPSKNGSEHNFIINDDINDKYRPEYWNKHTQTHQKRCIPIT